MRTRFALFVVVLHFWICPLFGTEHLNVPRYHLLKAPLLVNDFSIEGLCTRFLDTRSLKFLASTNKRNLIFLRDFLNQRRLADELEQRKLARDKERELMKYVFVNRSTPRFSPVTLNASFKQANTNIIDFEFWDVGEEAHFLQENNNMLVIGIFLNNPSSMLFIHIPVTYSEVEELFHLTKVKTVQNKLGVIFHHLVAKNIGDFLDSIQSVYIKPMFLEYHPLGDNESMLQRNRRGYMMSDRLIINEEAFARAIWNQMFPSYLEQRIVEAH